MLFLRTAAKRLAAPLLMQARRASSAPAGAYVECVSKSLIWSSIAADVPDETALAADAAKVCAWLGLEASAPDALDAVSATRVYDLYLPIYYWVKGVAARTTRPGPCVVFVSAPQGCGKTTICEAMVELFESEGKTAVALSYDDFYLTHPEQLEVASSGDRLLEFRGSAGTHDVALGTRVLASLAATGEASAPRYDKSAFSGRGDRAGMEAVAAADLVLIEGWMAGFKPVGAARAAAVDEGLPAVDAKLRAYDAWDAHADAWLVVALATPGETVYGWRLEAERRAGGGLSDAQVKDFVDRFLPSYAAYCPALYAAARSGGVDGKPSLCVEVDASRGPVGAVAGGPP